MLRGTIPQVDFEDFCSDDSRRQASFVRELGLGLEALGFVAVIGHGIPAELLERGYNVAQRLFDLPEQTKRAYETPGDGRQRGYTPFGLEHARQYAVPDLKEFWHVGRVLASDHPASVSGDVPMNQFPIEVPEFGETYRRLFETLESFASGLLTAVGRYLGVPKDFFAQMTRYGNSVLRVNHYPDMGHEIPPGAVRAAAHEDINLMTVLPSSTRPGLELMTRNGAWMRVEVPAEAMICDTGDMMHLVTAGKMPATTHRVVNPEGGQGGARLSMPFFLHPRSDYLLQPLDPNYAAPITTRDFLAYRLAETGVA